MSNLKSLIESMSDIKLNKHYDHEDGASLIAMESAEALRDIFEADFFTSNTCTINATLRGYDNVWESAYGPVLEASIKGVIDKIINFFKMLKNKVIDFIKAIKRFLEGLFASNEKWVKKYEEQLKEMAKSGKLKGYKIKAYEYTIPDFSDSNEIDKYAGELLNMTKDGVNTLGRDLSSGKGDTVEGYTEKFNEAYESYAKSLCGNSYDPDDLDKSLWTTMRNGANSESDKIELDVDRKFGEMFMAVGQESNVMSSIDKYQTKTNKVYDDAIKYVNSIRDKVDKADVYTTTESYEMLIDKYGKDVILEAEYALLEGVSPEDRKHLMNEVKPKLIKEYKDKGLSDAEARIKADEEINKRLAALSNKAKREKKNSKSYAAHQSTSSSSSDSNKKTDNNKTSSNKTDKAKHDDTVKRLTSAETGLARRDKSEVGPYTGSSSSSRSSSSSPRSSSGSSSSSSSSSSEDKGFSISGDAKSSYSALLSKYSSSLSRMQTAANKYVTAAKNAIQERNGVYANALKGTFKYVNKNAKKYTDKSK